MKERIAFVFSSISEEEVKGGLISPNSRTVALFRYLTKAVQNVSAGAETKLFIAAPRTGKATAAEMREHAEKVQKEIKEFAPTVVAILGKPAIYAVELWLPEDFPKTLKYSKLTGKYFLGNSDSAHSEKKRPRIVFCPNATRIWAGKTQEGGYLFLRSIQEDITGALLQVTDPVKTVSVYIDDKGRLDSLRQEWCGGSRLARISRQDTVAVDTETTGLNTVADKVRTVQFSFTDGFSYVIPFGIMEPSEWQELFDQLAACGYTFVLQNGKYDFKILKSNGVILPEFKELSIAHVLVDEREGTHNLDFIGQQLLGAGKESITKDMLVNGPIDKKFIDYAGRDTDITRRCFEILKPAVKDKKAYHILTDALQHMSRGEHYGIKLDTDKLESLVERANAALEGYTAQFESLELNPNSPKQVKEYFELSSNADKNVLDKLDDPIANAIIDYRGLRKILNTYLLRLKASANVDGRFHPDIRLAGPITGRTSSGSGSAPADMLWLPINSQNIPRPSQGQEFRFLSEELRSELRSLFIADEGRVMLGMDLAAAEMRMAANACLDPVMIDDLNRKVDTHSLLTIMAYGLPYEIDLDNPDSWVSKVKEHHVFQRQSTKNATFAVLYGGGISAIAAQAKCDANTAKLLKETIYKRYTGLETWISRIHNMVRTQGRVRTRYGRERIFPYSTGVFNNQQQQSMLREAQNYVIQSEASDYCLLGLNNFMSNIPAHFKPVYFQNFVHDALYFSVAEDDADEAEQLLVDCVENADSLPAKLYADAHYGKDWSML